METPIYEKVAAVPSRAAHTAITTLACYMLDVSLLGLCCLVYMLELRSQAPDDDPDEPQPKAVPRKILFILNLLIHTGGPGLLGRFRIKEGTAATLSRSILLRSSLRVGQSAGQRARKGGRVRLALG